MGFVLGLLLCGCTVDPGPNYVVADVVFNSDFYYCHVEPELIVAKKCGPGDPTKGDPPNSCHFSSVVTAMSLRDHPPVNCGTPPGDHPVDPTQIGSGSAAQEDLDQVSLEMSTDYLNSSLYLRPAGYNHPRAIFESNDPQVLLLLSKWAVQ